MKTHLRRCHAALLSGGSVCGQAQQQPREVTAGNVAGRRLEPMSKQCWITSVRSGPGFTSPSAERTSFTWVLPKQWSANQQETTAKKITSEPNRSHPFPHHSAPSYFHVHILGSGQTGEVTKVMNIQGSDQLLSGCQWKPSKQHG